MSPVRQCGVVVPLDEATLIDASNSGGAGVVPSRDIAARSPAPQRGYAQQQRVAVNAEGRFLAHWDEFVEHRKEVQAKLEEAFEMASERREAGLRLTRLCQQLETKVDRLARQSKEQLSKGESLEETPRFGKLSLILPYVVIQRYDALQYSKSDLAFIPSKSPQRLDALDRIEIGNSWFPGKRRTKGCGRQPWFSQEKIWKEYLGVSENGVYRSNDEVQQDLNTSLSSSKNELSEEVERHYTALQEAMRRGDRCLAEEFFRKLQESSEKSLDPR
eukprot:s539_g26.t2